MKFAMDSCKRITLILDTHTTIVDCNRNALFYLNAHTENDLIGLKITDLMSSYIAKLHTKHMFPLVKSIDLHKLSEIDHKINRQNMSMASRFIMFTVDKVPFMCGVSINIQLDYQGICGYIVNINVDVSHNTNALCGNIDAIPNKYTSLLGTNSFTIKNYENVTCIMMDVCGSTEYICNHTDENAAIMMKNMFEISRKHIVEMYPFVYIHELIGDCVFLIVDAPYMVRNQSNVAIEISRKIQRDVDKSLQKINDCEQNMYLRVGIACGPVVAGIIDGRSFRLFGLTVHTAQRLESVCPRGKITFNQKFKDKHNIEDCAQHCSNLKGLGDVTYYTL